MSAKLLTVREVAARLAVRPGTLHVWNWRGIGPKFIKIGRTVRYDPDVVEDFIKTSQRSSTSDHTVKSAETA